MVSHIWQLYNNLLGSSFEQIQQTFDGVLLLSFTIKFWAFWCSVGEETFLATLEQTYDSIDTLLLDRLLVLGFFISLFDALKAVFFVFLMSFLDEFISVLDSCIKK